MAGGVGPIGNLLGKVDASNALLVSLSGSFSGQLLAPVSATVPGYSFTGDTNTGYGSSAADTLALFAGGTTPRVTVTATAVSSAVELQAAGDLTVGNRLFFTDVILNRGGANLLNSNSSIARAGANGQAITQLQSLTELTTITAAATTDTTIQMPAGAVVLGVSVRVTTAIPTATNFTVGDSGSAARFSTAAVSAAANSTDPGTKAGAYYNATALSVRITPDASPVANTGRVRVTIYYYSVTPPTS